LLIPTLLLLWSCGGDKDEPTGPDPLDTGTFVAPEPGDPVLRFQGDPPRNVLMISIDTYRRDNVGRFGGNGLTPFFDQLMDEGVVAEDHRQCSNWTWQSTSCTLHGRYPEDIGHMPQLEPEGRVPIPPGQTTLATLLADAGFGTSLQSPNMWLGPEWGNAQGYHIVNPAAVPSTVGLLDVASSEVVHDLADYSTDGRWFMHVHLMEAHAPYIPPVELRVGEDELEPLPFDLDSQPAHYETTALWPDLSPDEQALLEAHLRVRYEGEVRWIDQQLETGWPILRERGVLDDTLVVVWTDHGEAFWEHGQQTHAHWLYGEETDGLLFFWADNLIADTWVEPTHAIDVVPTVLEAVGVDVPDDLPGYPVGAAPLDRTLFSSTYTRQGVLQNAQQRDVTLHYRWDNGQRRLYDRSTDPTEQLDLLVEQPSHYMLDRLWSELEPRVDQLDAILTDQAPIRP
jgi:arylsulfatase A-like enzyme